MKRLKYFSIIALFYNFAFSQTFEKLFNGTGYQMSMIEAFDSTFLVAYHAPDNQFFTTLMTLNTSGDSLRSVFYSNGFISIDNIIKSKDQNYLTVGRGFFSDLRISKLDINLDTIWVKVLPTFIPFYHPKILEFQDSSLLIVYVYDSGNQNNGIYKGLSKVVHTDKNGNVLWILDQGETNIWQDSNCAANDSFVYSAINLGVLIEDSILQLSCINPNSGNFEWQREYIESSGNPSHPIRNSASSVALKDSNIYLAGTTVDTSNIRHQLLMKFDLLGNLIWKKTFNEGSFSKILIANSNKLVCVGTAFDTITLSSYNRDGQEIWRHNFRNGLVNYINNFIIDYDSGFAFVAESRDSLIKMYVVKTDSAGNVNSTSAINEIAEDAITINCIYKSKTLITYLNTRYKGKVNLALYDLQGRLLLEREINSGINSLEIDQFKLNEYIAVFYHNSEFIKSYKFVNN